MIIPQKTTFSLHSDKKADQILNNMEIVRVTVTGENEAASLFKIDTTFNTRIFNINDLQHSDFFLRTTQNNNQDALQRNVGLS